MRPTLRGLLTGALGGAFGTAAMSGVMLAAQQAGLMHAQPPEAITAAALNATGVRPRNAQTQDVLAGLFHLAFGVGAGSVFGVRHRAGSMRVHPVIGGIAYATLVWAASYQGWVPALGIMPPASRDEPGRPPTMVLAHWVYGAVLGAVIGRGDHAANGEGEG